MTYPTPTHYEPPSAQDRASPLQFLLWYHRTMRLYRENKVNWTCVRDMEAVVQETLASFGAQVAGAEELVRDDVVSRVCKFFRK